MAAHTRVVVTWLEMEELCERIARTDRGAKPDAILGVSRGGLIPATMVAQMLGTRDVWAVAVDRCQPDEEGRLGDGRRLPRSAVHGPYGRSAPCPQSVLIVDDVASNGAVLEAASDYVESWGAVHVSTAVLFADRSGFVRCGREGLLASTCIGRAIDNTQDWIVFPWEAAVEQVPDAEA